MYIAQFIGGVSAGVIDQGIRFAWCDMLSAGEEVYFQTIITRVVTLASRMNGFVGAGALVGVPEPERLLTGGVLMYHIKKSRDSANFWDRVLSTHCTCSVVWSTLGGYITERQLPDIV
jgi:hypothetical protein